MDKFDALRQAEAELGALPETFTVATSRGKHLYFRRPEGVSIRPGTGRPRPGIDVRSEAGDGRTSYVIAPPSPHASGVRYLLERDAPFAELSDSWARALAEQPKPSPVYDPQPRPVVTNGRTTSYGKVALGGICETIAGTAEGGRRNALNGGALRLGSLIAGGHVSEAEAVESLAYVGRECGLGTDEVDETIRNGIAKGKESRTRRRNGRQTARPSPPRRRSTGRRRRRRRFPNTPRLPTARTREPSTTSATANGSSTSTGP